jgi:hypothetical protein
MARKLALRVVPLGEGPFGEGGRSNGGVAPALFSYGEVMMAMLRVGAGGRGLLFDEVVRAVEALAPIEQAIAEGAEEVTLSDEQWKTLRDKLAEFQFGLADQAIVTFGRMIREAPEIT